MDRANCEVLIHNATKIVGEKTVYVDPYMLSFSKKASSIKADADVVFVTHEHGDHYDPKEIKAVSKPTTIYVFPLSMKDSVYLPDFGCDDSSRIVFVEPGQESIANGVQFEAVPAYNLQALFHEKKRNWVGYVIALNGMRYYVAGDTDDTPEAYAVTCDVAVVPVGGKYTMDGNMAAHLVNSIKPKYVLPSHYGAIGGTAMDCNEFVAKVDSSIEVIL